jgi:protein involved in temperature-dependent protein secretion
VFSTLPRCWRAVVQAPGRVTAWLAISLIKRKLRRRPRDVTLLLPLARLYEVSGQWSKAVDTVELAHRLYPDSEIVAQLRTRILQVAGTAASQADGSSVS